MPFYLVNGDLVSMNVDAIVNAANVGLKMVEGVGRAIFHNAGDLEMTNACRAIGHCDVGEVAVTPSFNITNTKEIFHAVAPIYINGKHDEYELLEKAYFNCLELATKKGYKSIAFPLLGGEFNWPLSECYQVGKQSILDYLKKYNQNLNVFIVIYKNFPNTIDDNLHEKLTRYITSNFKVTSNVSNPRKEKFNEVVAKLIAKSKKTNKEVAFLANAKEKTLNRCLNDDTFIPSRNFVYALGVALRLNSIELQDFLEVANYKLNRADIFDLIILFFVDNNIFDVYKINDALFNYDYRPSLGER